MEFSVNFKSTKKDQVGEIRCPFNQLGRIYDFIKANPTKRYCIEFDGTENIDKLIEQLEFVRTIAADYTVACGSLTSMAALIEKGYRAYLRYPVVDWETFTNLKNLGVSDIYVDGPLAFQCDTLKIGKGPMKIRMSPTISPNASLSERPPHSFFIRPEDLVLYKDVVDIIDFKEADNTKEDTLVTIYQRGTFSFDISELIQGLNPSINNLFIKPDFASYRLNCGQKCAIPGRHCHLCDNHFLLSDDLVEYFRKKELLEKKE